jgi:hypothetical protein
MPTTPLLVSSTVFLDIIQDKIADWKPYESHIYKHGNNVTFDNVHVNGEILIEDIVVNNRISLLDGRYFFVIRSGTFNQPFQIVGGTYHKFEIENPVFNQSFAIQGGVFKNTFNIYGGLFKENFTIDAGTFDHGVRVRGGMFERWFQLTGGIFNRWVEFEDCVVKGCLYIHSATFQYGLQIHKGSYERLSIWQCPGIKNIFIKGSDIYIGTLAIRSDDPLKVYCAGVTLKEVDLIQTTFSKDVHLYLSQVTLHELKFDQFFNFGYVCLSEVKPLRPLGKLDSPSTIYMRNSSLGKVEFVNCDVSGFNIAYSNSKLTDISIIGGFTSTITAPDDDFNIQMRQFSGQMKRVFESRGDTIASLGYHTSDMNYYYDSLKFKWERNAAAWQMNWEIVNLWLNKISTNHGSSWIRGLVSTLVALLIFFIWYTYALGFRLSAAQGSWTAFTDLLSYSIDFLNPVHKSDYIPEKLQIESNAYARIVEGISRVFIAYFAYQLIQAFRKHGRRNS